MDYVYGVIWLIVAYMLIFKLSKENKIFIFLGCFFVVMAAWWILNAAMPEWNMLEGTNAWILRGIGAVVLSITGVFYYKNIYTKGNK